MCAHLSTGLHMKLAYNFCNYTNLSFLNYVQDQLICQTQKMTPTQTSLIVRMTRVTKVFNVKNVICQNTCDLYMFVCSFFTS